MLMLNVKPWLKYGYFGWHSCFLFDKDDYHFWKTWLCWWEWNVLVQNKNYCEIKKNMSRQKIKKGKYRKMEKINDNLTNKETTRNKWKRIKIK
jgi:hypothetical protein